MNSILFILSFFWDPPAEAFTVPYIDRPVVWYGILFVTGFILGCVVINPIWARYLKNQGFSNTDQIQKVFGPKIKTIQDAAYFLTERLCWFCIVGTIIGARLGEVFFYNWPYYSEHPLEIFKTWEGGLSSHGGVIGVATALYLYLIYIKRKLPSLTFLTLLDFVAIASALVAFFIRLGNFVNQEILGTPTNLPWGVIFGHPRERVPEYYGIPLHPVQLYEGFSYLITFVILWFMWKKGVADIQPGKIIGTMFVLIFGSRFILEFWKHTQDSFLIDPSFLQMGQWLSIPFILLGVFLIMRR